MTLAKFDPSLKKITVAEGSLTDYVQYENSDCLNGAILKVPDGRRMLDRLTSLPVDDRSPPGRYRDDRQGF
jgi:hypothetical protein